MNDRGLSVLESYDLKVLRTYRGRGAIICETNQGLKILREFSGSVQSPEEIGKAVINLAKLHKVMNLSYGESTIGKAVPIRDEYKKHTKELKKVKQYIYRCLE